MTSSDKYELAVGCFCGCRFSRVESSFHPAETRISPGWHDKDKDVKIVFGQLAQCGLSCGFCFVIADGVYFTGLSGWKRVGLLCREMVFALSMRNAQLQISSGY